MGKTKASSESGLDWLVRTAQHQILGPFEAEEIRKRIKSGELKPQDEICRANGYWIFVHERDELWAELGIELRRKDGDEVTETDTETVPELQPEGPTAKKSPRREPVRLPTPPQVDIVGMERSSFWQGFAVVMIVGLAFIVVAVLRLLKTSGPL